MTRINCVPPRELGRLHLIAEYRELPRIFSAARKAERRGDTPKEILSRSPDRYTLGPGHVIFFYTRLAWLRRRFLALVKEMKRRGYSPRYTKPKAGPRGRGWYKTWEPTPSAIRINRQRIKERKQSNG